MHPRMKLFELDCMHNLLRNSEFFFVIIDIVSPFFVFDQFEQHYFLVCTAVRSLDPKSEMNSIGSSPFTFFIPKSVR